MVRPEIFGPYYVNSLDRKIEILYIFRKKWCLCVYICLQ